MRHLFIVGCGALLAVATGLVGESTARAQAALPMPGTTSREQRGTLVFDGIATPDSTVNAALDNYLSARGATFHDFLPDGAALIGTRFADAEQLHRVAGPLADREQLTFFSEPTGAARVPTAANAEGLVFMQDRGGNENAQINFYRYGDRSIRTITDGRSLQGSVVWAHDGRRIAFHGTARDGASYDVYVAEPAAGTAPRLLVTAQQRTWYPLDWSPDDRRLLLLNYVSINEAQLYVADVATGNLTAVPVGATQPVAIAAAQFSADGTGVWLATDADSEFTELRYIDLASGTLRLRGEPTPWDVEEIAVAADGRYLATLLNVDGLSRVVVQDLGSNRQIVATGLPAGVIRGLRFDRSGRRLGLTLETAQSPRDVWVWDIERNAATRWTRSETGPVDPAKFVPGELVRFPTWDRSDGTAPRQIPAFVYRPRRNGPHPVLIDIHGGPEAQSRPTFDAFRQFLVNELGYVVITPNVRGSSGYGKTFLKLDNGLLREDSVRDIGSLLVWIAAQRDLDPKRVAVMGGSYGGYMTLASLAAYGDRLVGGIDVVGISNFVTFLQNTSAYRRDLRRAEYGDERIAKMRAFLTRISPLTNTGMIKRPLLVVQGLNDPRVPATESEQMVASIRRNGGDVGYLVATDEGHGFRKKGNRDGYLRTAASFLARLSGTTPP